MILDSKLCTRISLLPSNFLSLLNLRVKFPRSIYSMLFLTKKLTWFVVRGYCTILLQLMVYHLIVWLQD